MDISVNKAGSLTPPSIDDFDRQSGTLLERHNRNVASHDHVPELRACSLRDVPPPR